MDIELAKDIAKRIRESSVREVAYGIDNDVVAKVLEDLIAENTALIIANCDCVDWFENLKLDYDAVQAELATLQAKVATLHKAKGRYHNQIAICDLYDVCGLFNVRPISDARP